MNVNRSGSDGTLAMPMSEQMAVMPSMNGAMLGAKLFAGASVNVEWNGAGSVADPSAVLLSVMKSYFHALKVTAENLGTSKKMRELIKRKKEEIAEQMRELKDRKVDYEKARITFINCVASAEDKAYFEKLMSEMRPTVMA